MSSPRSMWSGSISLGLLSIPVSVGKATGEDRTKGIVQVCTCHGKPIDRTERCATTQKDAAGKAPAVDLGDGSYKQLSESEWAKIEEQTGSDQLVVEDYQKIWDLPLDYAQGTYYVRYNPPKKKSTTGRDAFAAFVQTLKANDSGAVVKWGSSSNQRLAILMASEDGTLLMRHIPFASEIREPGKMESEHKAEQVPSAAVQMFHDLLSTKQKDTFKLDDYTNDGVRLRNEAIDRVLAENNGGQGEQKNDGGSDEQQDGGQNVPDLMAQLKASLATVEKTEGEKV